MTRQARVILRQFADSLGVRLLILLTVALLPIGLIAVMQTGRVVDQARAASQDALLGLTVAAAERQRGVIQESLGAAMALASTVAIPDLPLDDCREIFHSFAQANPRYTVAGLIRPDAQMLCSSEDQPYDLRNSPLITAILADPQRTVRATSRGRISNLSVLILVAPVWADGKFQGIVTLSLPRAFIAPTADTQHTERPVELILFNSAGEVLLAADEDAPPELAVPAARRLKSLATREPQAFNATAADGTERTFATVPIVTGEVYVLGSWAPTGFLGMSELVTTPRILFPLLMWMTSLLVAYIAVHRLVLRHIRKLSQRMRDFASGQRVLPPDEFDDAPAELREVAHTFDVMTRNFTRDEAELENSIHEKEVLLKEVHHRVKNNLQLIASIMNMQIRRARTPEARSILKRVQDRVMSLATIHRNLYQTPSLSRVRADVLLDELVQQIVGVGAGPGSGIQVTANFDEVQLYPDQAVPLSLFTTEAATNALKYLGRPANGDPWIYLSLRSDSPGKATLEVINSLGEPVNPESDNDGTGLGSQLISAFTAQLDATIEREEDHEKYLLRISFDIAEFSPDGGGT